MIIKNPSTAVPNVTLTNTTAAPNQPNYSINPMYGSGSGGGWGISPGGSGGQYVLSQGSGGGFNANNQDFSVQGDLLVRGKNVLELIANIERRLAILVPNPKLLAKYEALREAYDHYKTLEALCTESEIKHD